MDDEDDARRRRLKLSEWRTYRGKISQEKLGALAGVTQGRISQIETGDDDWTGELLIRLSGALGCEPYELFLSPTDPRRKIVAAMRAMTQPQQDHVARIVGTFAPIPEDDPK